MSGIDESLFINTKSNSLKFIDCCTCTNIYYVI